MTVYLIGFASTFGVLAAILLAARLRMLDAAACLTVVPDVDRYQPMLRLLSDDDLNCAGMEEKARRKLRAHRRGLFRGYLRCLTKDYGALLGQIRQVVVDSPVDRPDLIKLLAKYRFGFALALCRLEIRLALHAAGIGTVDVSALIESLGVLRSAALLRPAPLAA